MAIDPWQLIVEGKRTQALNVMREWFEEDPDGSAMDLGIGLLYVKEFQAALQHFRNMIRDDAFGTSIYYGMAGTALWCLGEPRKAAAQWVAGLKCSFVDAAGGVELPLLLYYASIVAEGTFKKVEAIRLLGDRVNDERVENWPGPVAQYALGVITDTELGLKSVGMDYSDTILRRFQADFYRGIVAYDRGSLTQFLTLMKQTATTAEDDFDRRQGHYLRKLWHEEFFLARHESER